MSNLIDRAVTYRDVLSWRYHWLYCECSAAKNNFQVSHRSDKLAAVEDVIMSVLAKHRCIVYETRIMMELDVSDECEILKQITTIQSFGRFATAVHDLTETLKTAMRDRMEVEFSSKADRLSSALSEVPLAYKLA